MAKLFSSVSTFAREFASDMATMPRTKAAWPHLRTGLHEFYTELKNDLFHFNATRIAPVTGPASAKLNEALAQTDGAAKVEQLLEAREAAEKLRKVSEEQEKKGFIFFGLMFVAGAAGGFAFGAGALLTGFMLMWAPAMKMLNNRDAAGNDRSTIQEKVNSEILKIAATDASQVFSSPSAQKILVDKGFLTKAFRVGRWSAPDEQYAALAAKLPKPATPAAAAPGA